METKGPSLNSSPWRHGLSDDCCSPRPGVSLIPYGLPCIRELFRFLISLTNPHDRHNTDTMMYMGLQLLTVALESADIANYQSLLGLVKDELCRHLFQVRRSSVTPTGWVGAWSFLQQRDLWASCPLSSCVCWS